MPQLLLAALLILAVNGISLSQSTSGLKSLDLNDLSAFRPQDGNWKMVGGIIINPMQFGGTMN